MEKDEKITERPPQRGGADERKRERIPRSEKVEREKNRANEIPRVRGF
jgi:hypothetical protein